MAVYIVRGNLKHNGASFKPNSKIDLNDKQAENLLVNKVIELLIEKKDIRKMNKNELLELFAESIEITPEIEELTKAELIERIEKE